MSHFRSIDSNIFGDNATIHQGDINNNVFNYPHEQRETPPQPSSMIRFRRDPDFVNRGNILDQIYERCMEPAGRVALVGLGGVGKSQLAIEFAHRFADKHKNIWVFWIHAATQARVEEGFKQIAEAVKLPDRKQPKADIPLLVQDWLSIEHNGRWIIILDSADNSEVLYSANQSGNDKRPLAAYLPQSRNGAFVLTTRNKDLASKFTGGHKDIIEVGTMTETDALALLERKMGSSLDDASLAGDLVKALECIPLAISQAAAYIQARKPRTSIEKYLTEFRKSERQSVKLLQFEANDIGRYEETSNTVLRTWTISFEYIHSHQLSAANLLSLMSFFDRQGIPEWVLRDFSNGINSRKESDDPKSETGDDSNSESETGDDSNSESETDDKSENHMNSIFEDDISTLREHCLISVNEDGDMFEMHRLVQLSIKSWLKASKLENEFKQVYIVLIANLFPYGGYETWATCQELFTHAEVAINYRPDDDVSKKWAVLCRDAGHYAHSQGRYNIAERMVVKAKDVIEKKFGESDNMTLSTLALWASLLDDMGRGDEAEKLQVQVMESYKTKLGTDHEYTLISISNVAVTWSKKGRLDEAEKLQVQVLEARKTLLGTGHPETLQSMSNLASTYRRQGRLDEAEMLEMQVLEAQKMKSEAGHPDILDSMGSLASIYENQGRWEKAEELQLQVLEARKTKFGTDHPETLRSMNNLAIAYDSQGRQDEAEALLVQVLEGCKTKFGMDHPHTLQCMYTLALLWGPRGRSEDALALMKDCLQGRQRVFGLQHPVTLDTLEIVESIEKLYRGERDDEDDAEDWSMDDGEEQGDEDDAEDWSMDDGEEQGNEDS